MSLFKCEKCDCVENTALSRFWFVDKKLCSECDPKIGKWHGKFKKKKWDGKTELINNHSEVV